MKDVFISDGTIITDGKQYENPGILLHEGKIVSFGSDSADAMQYSAAGKYITPGFMDIHTHGAMGFDFTEGTWRAYNEISKYQARHGVTSLLATTLTMPMEEILRCCYAMREMSERPFEGSNILGLHLEGPFISKKNKGAHSEEDILPSEKRYYQELLQFTDVIRNMTVSPENEGAVQLIREFADRGATISGGHDDAGEPCIESAIRAGMTHSTHLFCVMSSIHRENGSKVCGLTELSLLDPRITTEVIADGVHTNEAMVKLAFKCKGAEGLCLVSDMLSVGGMPADGRLHTLEVPGVQGGLSVIVGDGVAKLAGSGLNAGSITPLDAMVRRVYGYGIPLPAVIQMVTSTPASVIGEEKKGSIQVGKDADLCILDGDLHVVSTIVGGSIVYQRNEAEK